MRTLPFFLPLVAACAVGALPVQEPDSGAPAAADAGPPTVLVLPARTAASTSLVSYPTLDAGVASTTTQLAYALGADYPSAVTVQPGNGYAVGGGCGLDFSPIAWSSILSVEGTAATVGLSGGALALSLREEGDLAVLLEGTVRDCTLPDGSVKTTLPLRHRIEVKVRRVAGFTVTHFDQASFRPAGCAQRLVLAEGAPLWLPTASPVDATGATFEAVNAPAPVGLTLRSSAPLALLETATRVEPAPPPLQFTAGAPGHVAVSADTALPVRGLTGFEVVGASSLTAVDLTLSLVKETLKCSAADTLQEGGSYALWYPERRNAVELRIASATTALGPLCNAVPWGWFAARSSTPAQCGAVSPITGQPTTCGTSGPTAATILALGECRLAVTVPGTPLRWTVRFTTTRQ